MTAVDIQRAGDAAIPIRQEEAVVVSTIASDSCDPDARKPAGSILLTSTDERRCWRAHTKAGRRPSTTMEPE